MKIVNITKEFIFENAPFESCHASTLVILPNKNILSAWFGGSREGANDVVIWISKRKNGVWTYPEIVSCEPDIPHWNPVLFRSSKGRIYLFYKVGYKIPEWRTMVMTSDDDGENWSPPKELVKGDIGGRGPAKNKILELANGTWLAPGSVEGDYWNSFVDISHDNGLTWEKSGFIPLNRENGINNDDKIPLFCGKGVIQPTLWESGTNSVHMLLRSTEGFIYRSDSCDGGYTWSMAYPTVLPNNNSGIDAVKLANGEIILVYNPVGTNWGPRSPLIIANSNDNGTTWENRYVLENENLSCEFSYPAVVTQDNEIYITYTWNRKKIVFCKIDIVYE